MVGEKTDDPFWIDVSRNLLTGLILHVLSWPSFKDIPNLVTVRRLLREGTGSGITAAQAIGVENMPTPFAMHWKSMCASKAFGGVVFGIGEQMASMMKGAEKTYSGVMEQARTNTAFIDGTPMQRILATSDFNLADLKTSPRGLTLYLRYRSDTACTGSCVSGKMRWQIFRLR